LRGRVKTTQFRGLTLILLSDDQVEEVSSIVEKATIAGFAEFFHKVKMTADADVADYWVKG
jgi:hypothetical protein